MCVLQQALCPPTAVLAIFPAYQFGNEERDSFHQWTACDTSRQTGMSAIFLPLAHTHHLPSSFSCACLSCPLLAGNTGSSSCSYSFTLSNCCPKRQLSSIVLRFQMLFIRRWLLGAWYKCCTVALSLPCITKISWNQVSGFMGSVSHLIPAVWLACHWQDAILLSHQGRQVWRSPIPQYLCLYGQ